MLIARFCVNRGSNIATCMPAKPDPNIAIAPLFMDLDTWRPACRVIRFGRSVLNSGSIGSRPTSDIGLLSSIKRDNKGSIVVIEPSASPFLYNSMILSALRAIEPPEISFQGNIAPKMLDSTRFRVKIGKYSVLARFSGYYE